MQNPLDDLFSVADLIERRKGTADSIPGLSSLIDDFFHISQTGSDKAEFVMSGRMKQSALLRHQSAQSQKEDGHAARKSLVGRESAGLGENKIGPCDESMNVVNVSERLRFRMAEGLQSVAKRIVAPANDQDIGMGRGSPRGLIDWQQRATTARATVEENRCRVIKFQFFAKSLARSGTEGAELSSNRHGNLVDSPGGNSHGRKFLQRFVRWNEELVHPGGCPTLPERREGIRQKGVAGNPQFLFFDKPLDEVVQHRMNGQNLVGLLGVQELFDELSRACVQKIALVWPAAIDEPEIATHLLGASRQNRVVKGSESPIELAGFFEWFSNRNLQSCGCGRRFQCSGRAIVSLSSVRRED